MIARRTPLLRKAPVKRKRAPRRSSRTRDRDYMLRVKARSAGERRRVA